MIIIIEKTENQIQTLDMILFLLFRKEKNFLIEKNLYWKAESGHLSGHR